MKKLLLSVLSLACAATVLTGCAAAPTASIFGGSYFLSDYENLSVGTVNETTVYNVTFAKNENAKIAFAVDNGTYTTHVYTSEYNGTRCYRLDTELNIKGAYTIDDQPAPIEDVITTTAYFLGLDNAFKPLYSERRVKAHSAAYNGEKYELKYYEYEVSTTYDDEKATVVFAPNTEVSTGKYSLEAGETVYKDVFKKTYFDNETLLFAIRSFRLSNTFGTTFDSIDAISKTKRTLYIAAATNGNSASNEAQESLDVSFTNGGEKMSKVDTLKFNLAVSGTYTGNVIVLNYSDPSDKKIGQQLIKMQTQMTGGSGAIGTLTYLISNITKY